MSKTAAGRRLTSSDKTGPRPTMIDVAELAQVSVGTVSRVVNDHPAVQEHLKKRVRAAMRSLNFTPNPVAQSMRTSSTHSVGVMVPNMGIAFFAQICMGAERALYEKGYTMTITSTWESLERELDVLDFFRSRRVDGVLANIADEAHNTHLEAVEALTVPIVLVQSQLSDKVNSVTTDHHMAIKQSLEYLFALGHRRIALVVGKLRGRERTQAYISIHKKAGVPVNEKLIHVCGLSPEEGARRTHDMMLAAAPPTAIIASSYQMAGVIRTLRTLEIEVPSQMSLISLGQTDLTELYEPSLTVVRWNNDELGRIAATLLLESIKTPRQKPSQIVLPVELVMRQSCAAPATSTRPRK